MAGRGLAGGRVEIGRRLGESQKVVEVLLAAATATDKPKQAKADKPKRKRQHWDEARIMREIYRYSGYAGMIGGW